MACNTDDPGNTTPTPTPGPEPAPTPTEIKSYTIMTYGCGGGELDEYYEACIKVVAQLDVPSHIKIVGQMKWSNGYKSEWSDSNGGVTRFSYDHATKKFHNKRVDDNSFKMDDPQNLAEFIAWARDEAPADEYIIVFMGHGNAYHPSFEGDVSRAILRDDENPEYLGLRGIVDAFEATDAHFGLTLMMCCLMNSIEYVTELEPYTNYYLASNHVTSISGGELYCIVKSLMGMSEYDDDSIAEAATYYIDEDYDLCWSQDILTIDHTLTKCSDIAELNKAIREFADIVVGLYDEQSECGADAMSSRYGFNTATINRALGEAYYPVNATFSDSAIGALQWYRMDYAFDIVDIALKVASATKYGKLVSAAEKIKGAAAEAITHQRDANLEAVDRVYYTAVLINRDQWETLGMELAGYEDTAFDKATGWSRLLKANGASFLHCR